MLYYSMNRMYAFRFGMSYIVSSQHKQRWHAIILITENKTLVTDKGAPKVIYGSVYEGPTKSIPIMCFLFTLVQCSKPAVVVVNMSRIERQLAFGLLLIE